MEPPRTGPPAGWYPDPARGGGRRWWDGVGWTATTAAGAAPAAGPFATPSPVSGMPATAPPRYPGVDRPASTARTSWSPGTGPGQVHLAIGARTQVEAERRMAEWGRRALVGMAVAAVAAAAVSAANWSHFAAFFHWYRLVIDASRHGGTPPPLPPGAMIPAIVDLPGLVLLASEIVFVVWQYRAAVAARALGLPARRTPRSGVVLWFIPIANLWCPYQAIRDCLPPGHPERRTVTRFWLALVAGELCGVGAVVAGTFARPAGIVLIVAAAGAWLVAVVNGRRVVGIAGDLHRTMAGS